jgi:hypothetical protein
MRVLKVKSPKQTRYGIVFWKRDNQRFLDFHFGKNCWMVAFF